MCLLNALLVISALLYSGLLLFAFLGWRRLSALNTHVPAPESLPGISVVVPFRNEAENLLRSFEDLNRQNSCGEFEVIWIDDHSEDSSATILRELISGNPQHQLLSLTGQFGKKAALKAGIECAKFNWILTTDADTSRSRQWLASVQKALVIHHVDMLILPVGILFRKSNALSAFLSAEHTAVQALSLGLAVQKTPVSCNGANLLFRKSAFDQVGGYEGNDHIPSGDDVFLMQSFLKNNLDVKAHWSDEAIVHTDAPEKSSAAIQQRLRWAGKTGRMSHPYPRIAGGILIFNAVILVITLFWFSTSLILWAGALLLRIITDVVLIKTVGKRYNQQWNLLTLTLISLLYVPYVLLMGIGSAIWRPQWKGRKT